jgi:multicomponent Na+:H+ antiporter subunit C
MSAAQLYALAGVILFCLGAHALLAQRELLRRILGANILTSGAFLALVGLAQRGGGADPVPQALVLTGIVIAVSATALALTLLRRLFDENGASTLDEGPPP